MSEFSTVNPANGQVISSYSYQSLEESKELLEKSHQSFKKWSTLSFSQRGSVLLKVAENLRLNKEKLATLIQQEMGKNLKRHSLR